MFKNINSKAQKPYKQKAFSLWIQTVSHSIFARGSTLQMTLYTNIWTNQNAPRFIDSSTTLTNTVPNTIKEDEPFLSRLLS